MPMETEEIAMAPENEKLESTFHSLEMFENIYCKVMQYA